MRSASSPSFLKAKTENSHGNFVFHFGIIVFFTMTAVQSNKKQIFLEHNLSLIWNIFPEIKRRRTVRSSKARMNQRDEKKKKTKCFLSGSLQTNHENASPSALGAHMATPQALLPHRKKKEKATVPQRRRHTCSVVAFHQLLTDDVVGEPKTPRSCSSG